MNPAGTRSGAQVTSVTPLFSDVSISRWWASGARIVHAGFFRRQERSFQMNPEHASFGLHRTLNGGNRAAHVLVAVADQRRQQRGGAVAAMRGGDRGNR